MGGYKWGEEEGERNSIEKDDDETNQEHSLSSFITSSL